LAPAETLRQWGKSHGLLTLLLAASIARLWLMPLPSSFWTDETGTFFVVHRPHDPSLAVVPQVPASIYYVLPRLAESMFGFSEAAYRVPSVLLMAIALFIIGRLAARLIEPEAAWFAVFTCFVISNFNFYAADARPYALGICITAASLWFLIDWFDTARWRSAVLFVLFAALLWRVHLAFWAFYPVFLIYASVRLYRATTKVTKTHALLVTVMLIGVLLPVAFDALRLLRNGRAHVIVLPPDFRAWIYSFPWKTIAWFAGLGWLAARLLKWPRRKTASSDALVLIAAVWVVMPLCLFAWSRLTGTVLFVPRYFSPALPGAALAATAVAACWLPRACWKPAAVAIAIVGLIWTGRWNIRWPDHGSDNWRQAAAIVNAGAEDPGTPVVAVSPFIEAQPPAWTPNYSLPGFLYAPLLLYPVRGRIYPFPYFISPAAEPYAEELLRNTLARRRRFIIYGSGPNVLSWASWFSRKPELAQWKRTDTSADIVLVVVFENPAGSAQ
jgi:hypothetical protein